MRSARYRCCIPASDVAHVIDTAVLPALSSAGISSSQRPAASGAPAVKTLQSSGAHPKSQVADTFHGDRKLALKLDRLLEVNTVEREAKALKRLQPCPCVVRLLEQGAHEGRGFMVMEVGIAHMRFLRPDRDATAGSGLPRGTRFQSHGGGRRGETHPCSCAANVRVRGFWLLGRWAVAWGAAPSQAAVEGIMVVAAEGWDLSEVRGLPAVAPDQSSSFHGD